jgi:hypothetical protein
MKSKIFFLFILALYSFNTYALLKFPEGVFILEGKIMVLENDIFLAVNYKTNSETRIKLEGPVPKELFSQNGSNASIEIKIIKPINSYLGKANFIELKKYLDPFIAPAIYNDERKLPKK